MKNQIDKLNNYANLAFGKGSQINQTAYVSVDAKQAIYNLIDRVDKLPVSQLSDAARRELTEHLHTLADQGSRNEARREPSKILTALQRIPAIASGVATFAESWQKIEPVVKTWLGF